MLRTTKEQLEEWRTYLVAGWYDHKSPAVNQDLITLWAELLDELEERFPDCVIWIAPASDSTLGMDFHKLLPGENGKQKWSDDMAIVTTDTPEHMNMWDSTSGTDDGVDEPFNKEKLFEFLETFRQRASK